MAIGTIELATIARSQDYSTIKHNDDTKSMVNQNTISVQNYKEIEHHIKQVRDGDNADGQHKKFDAKEKGSGEYSSDGGKKREKKQEEDGRVLVKGHTSRIDIKI